MFFINSFIRYNADESWQTLFLLGDFRIKLNEDLIIQLLYYYCIFYTSYQLFDFMLLNLERYGLYMNSM